ncbi:hypothetical protein KSS87_016906 [Heliosperma pusillum]|nr:hypothetical protein KSS87_016906 [Heliosperma pusillum]
MMYHPGGIARSNQQQQQQQMGDTKVETISRLAQWRIDNSSPSCSFKTSDPFPMGIWNWHLSIEKTRYPYVRLFPVPSKDHHGTPFARFFIRLSNLSFPCKPFTTSVQGRLLRNTDDFAWSVDTAFHSRFLIHVEFLDLKFYSIDGGEGSSIWPSHGKLQSMATQSALETLSRMLYEGVHADVTINTVEGSLKAHKAILAASSPVFGSMFVHDVREKESSTIEIKDMCWESCMALLSYLYGTIKAEEFWNHRLALLAAANKYDIRELKEACEESLMEDINSGNVLERLQEAGLYGLEKLKKGCMVYLFEFGKIYEVKDEISNLFKSADRELLAEMFQEVLTIWKPV